VSSCFIQLLHVGVAYVKKGRSEDVDMAVPETRSHDEAFTVNNSRAARDFDGLAGPHGKNVAVVYEIEPFSMGGSVGEG